MYIPARLSIKTKTALVIGFMFLVIFSVGGLGVYYLNLMAEESRKAETIVSDVTTILNTMESEFLEVEQSISEEFDPEKKGYYLFIDTTTYTKNLNQFYTDLQKLKTWIDDYPELRENYFFIESVYSNELFSDGSFDYDIKNVIPSLERIKVRLEHLSYAHSELVQNSFLNAAETADKVINYMIASGGLALFIGLIILFGFPSYISKPLNEITSAISDFKNNNYSRRVKITKHSEFAELSKSFNQMAEHIEKLEFEQRSRIVTEEVKSKIILDNLREAVLITDSKNYIVFINKKLEHLIDSPKDKVIGQYAPDMALEYSLIRDIIKNISITRSTVEFLTREVDGKKRYYEKEVLKIISPLNLEDTKISPDTKKEDNLSLGTAIILKDITDFTTKDIAKTNLISTISHELKTPISSIKMSAQLLADNRIGNLNGEQNALVDDVKAECERLLRITKELVDMSQLDTGKISINISNVDAREFISKAIESVKFQSDLKNITINNNIPDKPLMVQADLEKSNLVVVNLLTNAIKFSDEGSSIDIVSNLNSDEVIFTIQDYGIGIEDEYKVRIFERYFQIDRPNEDKTVGTGLGLAICRDFITEQKGRIWVESEPGKGSAFKFSIPADNGKSKKSTSEERSISTIDDYINPPEEY